LLNAGTIFDLTIKYSIGYFSKDNSIHAIFLEEVVFIFVSKDGDTHAIQDWTQGDTLKSRYWFVCIDGPQIKYPMEIRITVASEDYVIISNGLSDDLKKAIVENANNIKKVKWVWNESSHKPAYLISIVIAKFHSKYVDYDDSRILLNYFWI
jgi:aminopeptidase N